MKFRIRPFIRLGPFIMYGSAISIPLWVAALVFLLWLL